MIKSESFISNLSAGIRSRIKNIATNPYSKADINWITLKYLKHIQSNRLYSHLLFRHKTFFYDGKEYLHGVKEIFVDEIYKQYLPVRAQVLDCGAHIGLSVIYIKRICPSAHIVAFEPDPRNFNLLQKNVQSRQFSDVELKNEAVWIEDTTLEFTADGNMGSKINANSQAGSQKVTATRLKKYLNKHIDFLKLDIEAAEYAVIKDIADELNNVTNLFLEYHGSFEQNNELLEILDILHGSGFHFYIKEATEIYKNPFLAIPTTHQYDVQLNIFCTRIARLPVNGYNSKNDN